MLASAPKLEAALLIFLQRDIRRVRGVKACKLTSFTERASPPPITELRPFAGPLWQTS